MALGAARKTEVLHGGDVRVGRVVDTVVDKETGVAAQRERVLAAVPDEHGNVITMMQERIRTVRVVSEVYTVHVHVLYYSIAWTSIINNKFQRTRTLCALSIQQ